MFEAAERSRLNLFAFLFALLIIPTLLMGATFPVVTRIIARDVQTVGDRVGKAYALNTAGSILGTLAPAFIFLPVFGLQVTLYILFGMNITLAAALITMGRTAKSLLGDCRHLSLPDIPDIHEVYGTMAPT